MATITAVKITGITVAVAPATGWDIAYSYTFQCTQRECEIDQTFTVFLDIMGDDMFVADTIAVSLALPGAACPTRGCPPVTHTGTLNYPGSLNEDWGKDEIYIEIRLRSAWGVLSRGRSSFVRGDFS